MGWFNNLVEAKVWCDELVELAEWVARRPAADTNSRVVRILGMEPNVVGIIWRFGQAGSVHQWWGVHEAKVGRTGI